MAKQDYIDATYVREALSYDVETGKFIWRKRSDMTATWNIRYAGTQAGWFDVHGYIIITIKYVDYRAHRLAWLIIHGLWPKNEIDHINGDPADNRLSNLREATSSQNKMNVKRRVDNTSGVKGVSWDRSRNVWAAYVKVYGKKKHLGRFQTIELAKQARNTAAREYYGKFESEEK